MVSQWQVGDKIQGRWQVHKIMKGGMGVVYVVYDEQLKEPFAAKTFQDEMFARSPSVFERFRREALIWIKLDAHPNVALASFVENIQGRPFIFLEYVSGGSLRNWIGTPRLTEDIPQVMRFAIQFCDGMTHALSKGVVAHRDIKPDNCLVTEDLTLKVTDFGLAKVVEDSGEATSLAAKSTTRSAFFLSQTGAGIGTLAYMAPEQFEDGKNVDVRADIYSLGVMLFEMLTGGLPFVGRTCEEFYWLHTTGVAPHLPPPGDILNDILDRCLTKDPSRRFPSFSALREQLGRVYNNLTGKAARNVSVARSLDALIWNNKGVSLNALGFHEEAINCLSRSLGVCPTDEKVWVNKGVALGDYGRNEEAITCFDRALALNPALAAAWLNKGATLLAAGRANEALACLDHALSMNSHDERAWCNRGTALGNLRQYEAAILCFQKSVKLNPKYDLAWNNMGYALFLLGRINEALECYERTLAINPICDLALLNKGEALRALRREREAIACYDKLLAYNRGCGQAWLAKGFALADALRRYADALPCFEEAQRLGALGAEEAIANCRKRIAPNGV